MMKETAEKPKRQLVRSELNLEQNSVFTVSTYRKKSREIVVREKTADRAINERKVIIGKTAQGVETGVLTTSHFKVYLALLELWEKAEKPIHEPVHFTILKLANRLDLSDDGRTYAEMKRWLRDLRQIPLTFIHSFFIPRQAEYADLHDITILNHLYLYERKNVGAEKRTRGYGEFRFDDYIIENLIANHTHPLRLDIVKSFKKHKDLSILLYTYLDRNLAFRDQYEIGLQKLFEQLDLSQSYIRYPSKRKTKINPVVKQLEGQPLSTGILGYCRVHKTEDGKDYKLVAHKKPFEVLPEPESFLLQLEPSKPDLVVTLKKHGLTESQAEELFRLREEKSIRTQLEALAYRIKEYRSQGKEANEPAILYRSIKENWSLPGSYLEVKTKEEREKRAKHYVLWHCRRYGCENFHKTIMSPREKGSPPKCPLCGADIEVTQEDYIVYRETKGA